MAKEIGVALDWSSHQTITDLEVVSARIINTGNPKQIDLKFRGRFFENMELKMFPFGE